MSDTTSTASAAMSDATSTASAAPRKDSLLPPCCCEDDQSHFIEDFDDADVTSVMPSELHDEEPVARASDQAAAENLHQHHAWNRILKWPKKIPRPHHKHHKERKAILLEAKAYGDTNPPPRHLTVIYNPISGSGIAKKIVDHLVLPVLTLAKVTSTVVATEYRGFAIEYMMKLDPETTNGILIAGGDGLVHEVVTGLMRRPDRDDVLPELPLGLVPSGTANAMAHALHTTPDKSHAALVGRATLNAAKGQSRLIDVISCEPPGRADETIYALSVMGWGLSGTVAKVADQMRWLKGQKRFRYDIAGLVSMFKDWPVSCPAKLKYVVDHDDGTEEWVEKDIDISNFTATSLAYLGADHPIHPDVKPNDGSVVVTWADSSVSRSAVAKMGINMKHGKFLALDKHSTFVRTREFILDPLPGNTIDIMIDGDPHPPSAVHTKVLKKTLSVFGELPHDERPDYIRYNDLEVNIFDEDFDGPCCHEEPADLVDDDSSVGSESSEKPSTLHRTTSSQSSIASAMHKVITFPVKLSKKVPRVHKKQHKERKAILADAAAYGHTNPAPRHLTVIYNPVSGAGIAKKIVDHMVVPVLTLAKCDFKVVATECRGFATNFMLELDADSTDGVLIAGGDGLVHEVVTGVMRRKDYDAVLAKLPLGLIPSGTANAMAHELHSSGEKTHISICGRAALAAAKGHTRPIDVISCQPLDDPENTIFALSVMGWGLAGTVAKVADQMRWLPGQKRFRYDIAGFVTMVKDWPPRCPAKIQYRTGSGEWTKEDISCINLTASNLPYLGLDHPIHPDVRPDDGVIMLTWLPDTAKRTTVASMGIGMKRGKFLGQNKHVHAVKCTEFKIIPEPGNTIEYNIDGDPHEPVPVHVTMLQKYLNVFAETPQGEEPQTRIAGSTLRRGSVMAAWI